MAGDVEAEDLLLARQPLGFALRRDVRERRRGVLRRIRLASTAEERALSARALLLLERCLLDRRVQDGKQLCAMALEAVERTGPDERLEHALVAETEVDAVAQLEDRLHRA